MEMIRDEEVSSLEKLRLALIYALRYEGDGKVGKLKEELQAVGGVKEA
jgi:hypothetical protein